MNAKISLRSKTEGEEISSLLFVGSIEREGNVTRILYDENDPNGLGSTRTELTFSDKNVVLARTGEYTSVLYFSEGNGSDFVIKSPFGEIPMSLFSDKIVGKNTENGFMLSMDYVITAEGQSSHHSLKLHAVKM